MTEDFGVFGFSFGGAGGGGINVICSIDFVD